MPTEDYNIEPIKNTGDPRTTPCDCKTSMVLPKFPSMHCPKCHSTWTARGLQRSVKCHDTGCSFNLRAWRRRNNIPDLNAPFL